MSQTIDTRTYHAVKNRVFILPNGSQYAAPWMDDLEESAITEMVAQAQESTTIADLLALARRDIRRFIPSITDEDMASLKTFRDVTNFASDLKQFEDSFTENPAPLAPPPSK